MKPVTKNLMRGLLTNYFYSINGSLLFFFGFCLIIGILSLITESFLLFWAFAAFSIGGPSVIMITKIESTSNWARFQVSAPVKRKNLVDASYLSAILAMLPGLPLVGAVAGMHFIIYGGIPNSILNLWLLMLAYTAGSVFMLAALIYPFAKTGIGQNNEQALISICVFIGPGIMGGIALWATRFNIPPNTAALLMIAVSVPAFAVSYAVSRKLYVKIDF